MSSSISVVAGDDKSSVRSKVWDYMDEHDLVSFPRPCTNRIPNFKGAIEASDRVANLQAFKKAQTVKVHADKPLEHARFKVLEAQKRLVVPSPRLRHGLFSEIIPEQGMNTESLKDCVTSKGIRDFGKPLALQDKLNVDLMITGSVAVSASGIRIGKGEGFGDLEFAMAASMGVVTQDTVVVTIVHDCQVLELSENLVDREHDLPVDIIVTPTRVIQCQSRSKPKGIVWSKISRDKLRQINVLKDMRAIEREKDKDVELMDAELGGAGDNDRRRREGAGRRRRGMRGGARSEGQRNIQDEDVDDEEYYEEERNRPRRRFRDPTHDLWVGALPHDLRVSDFKAKVRESCSPIRVRWYGWRGFAYLCFQEQDSADEALKSLDGLEFDGKECVVQAATQRSGGPGGSPLRQRYDDEGDASQYDRRRRQASDDEEYEEEEYNVRSTYNPRGRGRGGYRGSFRGGYRDAFRGRRGRGGRGSRVFRPRRDFDDYSHRDDYNRPSFKPQRRERRRPLRPALKITGLPDSLRVSEFKAKIRETLTHFQVIWRKRGEAQLLFDDVAEAEHAQQDLKGLQFEGEACQFQVVEPSQINGSSELDADMSRMNLDGQR